jgi:rhodanese-related sulfurtransferase|tara:strand:+ start:13485 stop:14096 length:612 start_codon:yes stop_codon:yes gene_type:complete
MDTQKTILIGILVGAIVGAGASVAIQNIGITDEDRIRDFYLSETAVIVSPHGLRKKMDRGDSDFLLVDVRSQEEYEEEHIVGAVNVPAYSDRFTSAYGEVDRIVNSFRELIETNPEKDIIVYCYSIPCMTGRKVGKMLAGNDMYVKELGIGWNEWRYFWTLWNHPHEWDITSPEEYVVSGTEPGIPTIRTDSTACPIEGEFGC